MSTRLHLVVEGQTEMEFAKQILRPHLSAHAVHITVSLLRTSNHQKGGVTSYGTVKREVERLLAQDPAWHLSTMIDLYALPTNFPGYVGARALADPYDRVQHLEHAFAEGQLAAHRWRLIPYFQLHEFEALLFSHASVLQECLDAFGLTRHLTGGPRRREAISLGPPERINDGRETAPSKRLQRLAPGYQKNVHGPLIAERIGLGTIRSACPHFDQWITRLEQLGSLAR